jgi:hypothetical protein
MPERSCNGCTRQKEWGCTASKSEVPPGTKGAAPSLDGKTWWLWTNPSRLPLMFDGEQTYACPRQHLKANGHAWHKVLLCYGYYKAGFLPQAGSVIDQSNKAVELFPHPGRRKRRGRRELET